ncbi:MAP7 domain-containing protein 3 isoform X2 [Tenrec ecaudatus]|uniref:MAP7 domain-containing protein 3 isoform X2 n=1 Tax=Tenrec ecaudatus TaxID=94439 RepID=UPI003F59F9AC
MAEGTGAGPNSTLRGLRKRMVAAAHAIAEERRNQSGISADVMKTSNVSSFKPVIDGSVLRNDLKQQLAKERREQKRLQDANKEIQLLEKERKAKLLYEKQLEEKHRKLRQQNEKEEQRRASAEFKRKQKLQEDKERYKAVLTRTSAHNSRGDLRPKRWSWESSFAFNVESGSANRRSSSTEKVEQKSVAVNRPTCTTATGLHPPPLKRLTEKKRSASLSSKDIKMYSSTELDQLRKEEKLSVRRLYPPHAIVSHLLDPTLASLARSKSVTSLSIPGKETSGNSISVVQHPKTAIRTPRNDEPKTPSLPPNSTISMLLWGKPKILPKGKVEMPLITGMEAFPTAGMKVSPKTDIKASSEPKGEASPKVSPKTSVDITVEAPPEAGVDVCPGTSMDVRPKTTADIPPTATVEASGSEMCVVTALDGKKETSSQSVQKSASGLGSKKRSPSNTSCYRWSSTTGGRPPSPMKPAPKNRPPTPFSKTSSNSNKGTSVQQTGCAIKSPTRSTPGTVNAEEATKILTEKRRLARELKEKEEEEQAKGDTQESAMQKMQVLAKRTNEGLGSDLLIMDQQEEVGMQSQVAQEEQPTVIQKGDAKIKAQEEANEQKKERERRMLQNLQERLERKKRIEEIMKRTRKSDINPSKASEIFYSEPTEDNEADDEEESSDNESDETTSSESSSVSIPPQEIQKARNFRKKSFKLTYLDARGDYTTKESTALNGDVKMAKKSTQDALIQAKAPRRTMTKAVGHSGKTRNASSKSLGHKPSGWLGDRILSLADQLEPPRLLKFDVSLNNQRETGNLLQSPRFSLGDSDTEET